MLQKEQERKVQKYLKTMHLRCHILETLSVSMVKQYKIEDGFVAMDHMMKQRKSVFGFRGDSEGVGCCRNIGVEKLIFFYQFFLQRVIWVRVSVVGPYPWIKILNLSLHDNV